MAMGIYDLPQRAGPALLTYTYDQLGLYVKYVTFERPPSDWCTVLSAYLFQPWANSALEFRRRTYLIE